MTDSDNQVSDDLDEFLDRPAAGMWTRRRKIIAAIVAALLVILLIIWATTSGGDQQRYAVAEVARGDMTVYVNATGNLEPTNEVAVGSELSGLIEQVYVDVNDRVTRGQPLAQIDRDKLYDQIRRSRAALDQARASVLQSEASVRQAQASLARLQKVRELSGGKVPSDADLDAARAEYQRNLASLASARASVSSAQAQLATDQTDLAKATIRSPVNGVVLSRQVEPGQTVAASFNTPTLFVIAEDLTQMELEVKVDEADVGQVEEGQRATFTVDAYPGERFSARITRVNVGSDSSADSTATSSDVIAYGAVLAVDNADLKLRPGMTATADILTSRKKNVLMVPNAALRFSPTNGQGAGDDFEMFSAPGDGETQAVTMGRGSTQTVYVQQKNGSLKAIRVRIGSSNGEQTIVEGNALKPGMKVVTGELAEEE